LLLGVYWKYILRYFTIRRRLFYLAKATSQINERAYLVPVDYYKNYKRNITKHVNQESIVK